MCVVCVSVSDHICETEKDFFSPTDRTLYVIDHNRVQGVKLVNPKEVLSCDVTQHIKMLDIMFGPELDKKKRQK